MNAKTSRSFAMVSRPCSKEVKRYLAKWEKQKAYENYREQEKALEKLFISTFPENKKLEEVLIKVAALNDFYSTNIFSTSTVAKKILSLNIDDRLFKKDLALVKDIEVIRFKRRGKEAKVYHFYSFATKYCSHHQPKVYAIYDRFVVKTLMYFRDNYSFYEFKRDDLKEYDKFLEIYHKFIEYFELQEFSVKEIDRYLWMLGRDIFSKFS